jgi:hypothetical protein
MDAKQEKRQVTKGSGAWRFDSALAGLSKETVQWRALTAGGRSGQTGFRQSIARDLPLVCAERLVHLE